MKRPGGIPAIGAIRAGLTVVLLLAAGMAAEPVSFGHASAASAPTAVGAAQAADTTYHKWSLLAIEETKHKYPKAALIDYLHIGRTQLGNGLSEEKFKLWLRQDNREFGVYVTVRFRDAEDRLVSIVTRESGS